MVSLNNMIFFLNKFKRYGVEIGEYQKPKNMKNLIITLTSIFIGCIALPEKAQAGHDRCGSSSTYRSGYSSCGCSVYKRRVIASYDCHRRPVYRYYSVPIVHRCRSSHYNRHNSYNSHSRTHYSRSRHSSYRQPSRSHRSHSSISYRSPYGSISFCR